MLNAPTRSSLLPLAVLVAVAFGVMAALGVALMRAHIADDMTAGHAANAQSMLFTDGPPIGRM